MQRTIDETLRRREIQKKYNKEHNITPTQIVKSKERIMRDTQVADGDSDTDYSQLEVGSLASDPVVKYMSDEQLEKSIAYSRKMMEKAAKDLDFIEAARLRDEVFSLEKIKKSK